MQRHFRKITTLKIMELILMLAILFTLFTLMATRPQKCLCNEMDKGYYLDYKINACVKI